MSDVKPQYHVVSFVIPTLREYTFGESLDYLLANLDHLAGHQLELVVVDDSDDDGRTALSTTIDEAEYRRALQRIRAEFLEMPGMHLTTNQVQRLAGVNGLMCTRVLDELVVTGLLSRGASGTYKRS